MIYDHYSGFEGEGEITFRTLSSSYVVTMWSGYFSFIMAEIPPKEHGWEGLTLYFHTYTGWYANSPFILGIDELAVITEQLQTLDNSNFHSLTEAAYQDLLMFFTHCRNNALEVEAEYC